MKKVILSIAVAFITLVSFTSFGQAVESTELFRSGSTSISFFNNSQTYYLSSQNRKYSHITDFQTLVFKSKSDLNDFVIFLEKNTNILNYKSEYAGSSLIENVNGRTYRFTLHKVNTQDINPERKKLEDEMSSVAKTLSLRKSIAYREQMLIKISNLPLLVDTGEIVEMSLFTDSGWIHFNTALVEEIKLALK